ncbi:hypothetical protein QUA07_28200 [Microcoleus sp. T3_A4]|uniref:hypothetical protein n=1 Tax=Microcoleus sp. T3_A4 TaxID=2818968 RepID=UPI002FD13534
MAKERGNYSTLTIISQQLNQQLEAERADRQQLQSELDRTLTELAKLKENPPPAIEQNPAPAIDLSDKAGKVANFLKTLLATDAKLIKDIKQAKDIRLPKGTISKIEEILGGGDG